MRRSDEAESRKFLHIFSLFIPSDFLAKITFPCNKGRLRQTVISADFVHLITAYSGASRCSPVTPRSECPPDVHSLPWRHFATFKGKPWKASALWPPPRGAHCKYQKGAVKNSRQKERLQVTEKGMLAVVFVV